MRLLLKLTPLIVSKKAAAWQAAKTSPITKILSTERSERLCRSRWCHFYVCGVKNVTTVLVPRCAAAGLDCWGHLRIHWAPLSSSPVLSLLSPPLFLFSLSSLLLFLSSLLFSSSFSPSGWIIVSSKHSTNSTFFFREPLCFLASSFHGSWLSGTGPAFCHCVTIKRQKRKCSKRKMTDCSAIHYLWWIYERLAPVRVHFPGNDSRKDATTFEL